MKNMRNRTKKITAFVLFSALALIGYQFKFSSILGVKSQAFTFFQFVAPTIAQFLGVWLGAISVVLVELINFIFTGKGINLINMLRFLPAVGAALYFGSKNDKKILAVPLIAIALFILHPEGRGAWVYSLYWLIPVIAKIKWKNNLFARSLGATFTAHSIGAVLFLYAFNLPTSLWLGLIPITAFERFSFAVGICASYLALTSAIEIISERAKIDTEFLNIEKRYNIVNFAKNLAHALS